ncbi:MAG: tetratricopeptide repeat protein [Gemmatimonadetes bacterium]|nr:tetratricopeptide repeat protein [Gemmatimonadota bacterium]
MKNSHHHLIGLLLLFGFASVAYGWLFAYVPVLQYEAPDCFFSFGREFLLEWLDHPGGLLLYAGRFLRQFYHYTWLGALVIAAAVTAFTLLLYLVQKRLSPSVPLFHTFFPGLFLLVLHPISTATIGLIAASVAFLGYLLLPGRARRGYALLATVGLYFVAGGFFWFFIAWVVAAEWLHRPWPSGRLFKILYPLTTACLPLVGYRWFFQVSFRVAFVYPFDIPRSFLDWAFFSYLVFLPLWVGIDWKARLERFRYWPRSAAAQAALLIGVAGSLLFLSYDENADSFADYHRLYKDRQWEAILYRARRDPSPAVMTQFFTNYALCKKGRLLDEMFHYPQTWGTRGLVLNFPEELEAQRKAMYNSDLFFEMGHINAAFRCAFDQMNQGFTYANLKRVAECNIVNGNYAMAEKYLNILEKTLFHREFVRRYRDIIADTAAADRHFAHLRSRIPTVEFDCDLGRILDLLALQKSDPGNRLAFEYLTAWCLLAKTSLPLVVDNIHRFAEAGYTSLPIHCQEALMLWESSTGTAIDTRGFAYDAETRSRFGRFMQQLQRYPSTSGARVGLQAAFGGTYMYYCTAFVPPREGTPSSSWIRLGNELFFRGEVDEAISCYRQVLWKDPESFEAHVRLGNALMFQGKSEEAEAHFRQALQIRPEAAGMFSSRYKVRPGRDHY